MIIRVLSVRAIQLISDDIGDVDADKEVRLNVQGCKNGVGLNPTVCVIITQGLMVVRKEIV